MISRERLAGHCPVHGCKETKQNMRKTSCRTAPEQNVFQNSQNYQTSESQRFVRGGSGRWSYKENSGQNLLPELPEYFKRASSQSSVSTTKTSNTNLSLKKNINVPFSSAVRGSLQVINNYPDCTADCTDGSLATKSAQ